MTLFDRDDAGGISASSRWLSAAEPSGFAFKKDSCTPAGVQERWSSRRPAGSSLTLLDHRLEAAMPTASFRSKHVIYDREAGAYNPPSSGLNPSSMTLKPLN